MKKISRIFIAALAAISAVSCDFLNEEPHTSLTDAVSFDSEAVLESNMFAIYTALNVYGNSPVFYYLNAASRMTYYTGTTRSGIEFQQTSDMTMYSKSDNNKSIYSSIYSGINYCNTLIDGLEGSPVDAAYKKEIEGEARFFRAFYYFSLVRMYGDVPLLLRHAVTTADACVPRTRYDLVYKQILEDLEFAEENMRTKERQEAINCGLGRSYRQAATLVKAQVYMWIACYLETPDDHGFGTQKTGALTANFESCGFKPGAEGAKEAWTKCLKAAEDVINSGVYSLEPDFRNLFRWDVKNYPEDYQSDERVLVNSVTNNSTSTNPASWTVWDYPILNSGPVTIHSGNNGRVRPQRWIWEIWCKKYGGTLMKSPDKFDVYSASPDPRLAVSIQYDTYQAYDVESGKVATKNLYPTNAKANDNSHAQFIRKYLSQGYAGGGTSGDADVYIIRFSEAYLIAAEASASLGNKKDAVDYVNEILTRARKSVDDPDSSPAAEPHNWKTEDFATTEDLIDAIMYEHEFEFCFEGCRWFNLRRRGATWMCEHMTKPLNAFMNMPAQEKIRKYSQFDIDLPDTPEKMRDRLFMAFPDWELRYNTSLTESDQNYFWVQGM